MTVERSKTFAHSRNIEKVIDRDRGAVGYTVIGGASSGVIVTPLYHADIHCKIKNAKGKPTIHVFSSYERGDRMNGYHHEDPVGARLAIIAAHAIQGLEDHRAWREREAKLQPRSKKRGGRR
jgi:hypothetical protein